MKRGAAKPKKAKHPSMMKGSMIKGMKKVSSTYGIHGLAAKLDKTDKKNLKSLTKRSLSKKRKSPLS
ncbi:MAG: hypothetical protein KGI50_08180 [Patescibacteria group bacterium]|nr:hypothetical protein [Patescibacteria group bacterium]MDE2439131.1 hypothetical protein [Patescibacteria group bacterium]